MFELQKEFFHHSLFNILSKKQKIEEFSKFTFLLRRNQKYRMKKIEMEQNEKRKKEYFSVFSLLYQIGEFFPKPREENAFSNLNINQIENSPLGKSLILINKVSIRSRKFL